MITMVALGAISAILSTVSESMDLRDGMLSDENNRNRRPVIDSLFDNPYIMVSDVMDRTGLTRPGALKLIGNLEDEGILEEVSGRQRGRVYLCKTIRDAEYK